MFWTKKLKEELKQTKKRLLKLEAELETLVEDSIVEKIEKLWFKVEENWVNVKAVKDDFVVTLRSARKYSYKSWLVECMTYEKWKRSLNSKTKK
jgi:hypothetical protein